MRVLGIDTATPNASVAIVEDQNIIAQELHGPVKTDQLVSVGRSTGNHAEILVPLIQTILERGQCSLADISGIAVSIGPGSFTGLRIALATVKGLAYDCGLPVVGVSTLHANAARVTNSAGVICSMLDARKKEVYMACFRRSGEILTRLTEDRCCALDAAIDDIRNLASKVTVVIGDGATAYGKSLGDAFGGAVGLTTGDEFSTIAAQVAYLSLPRLISGSSDDLGVLSPVYLRASEAEKKRDISL